MSASFLHRPGIPGAKNWYLARAWGPLGKSKTDFRNFHFKTDFFRKINFFDLAWSDFGIWSHQVSLERGTFLEPSAEPETTKKMIFGEKIL